MRLWRNRRRSRSGALSRSSTDGESGQGQDAGRGEGDAGEAGQPREAVHQGDETAAEKRRAGQVEAFAAGVGPLPLEPDQRESQGGRGDGNGRPEDAPPAPGVDEEAAEDRAERQPGVDGGRVQSEGVAAGARGIDRSQDGDARAEDHGPAEALDGASEDENGDGRGDGADDGPDDVDGQAEGEDPLPADEVGQPAERHEEHRRGQGVSGEDPAEGDGARAELACR